VFCISVALKNLKKTSPSYKVRRKAEGALWILEISDKQLIRSTSVDSGS